MALDEIWGRFEIIELYLGVRSELIFQALFFLPPCLQVRAVKLIPEEFSLENRLLTPTMKCARHVIRKHYQEELRQLFARKELD